MTGLKLRGITSGRAVVCERSTGWPVALLSCDRQRFTFPGRGSTTANVWTVAVGNRVISEDRTRRGAVELAGPILERRGLIKETSE